MERGQRAGAWSLLAVGLVAFLPRLAWVLLVRAVPVSDYLFYHLRAIDLVQGRGYAWYGHPTAFWPPGYPLFLAALYRIAGPSVSLARFANVLLWTVTALLAYFIGARLGGQRTGLVSGLLVALYPDFIFYSSVLASESLFVALLTASLGLVILVITRPAGKHDVTAMMAAGLLLGFASVTRVFSLLVPVLLVPVLLNARDRGLRQKLALCGIIIGCTALVVLPWVVRNWVVMGRPVLATEAGVTLWIGNHHGASGAYSLEGMPAIAPSSSIAGEMARNEGYTRLALDFIVRNPIEWLSYGPRKFRHLFGRQPVIYKSFLRDTDGQPGGELVVRRLSAAESWIRSRSARIASDARQVQAVYWLLGSAGLLLAAARRRIAAMVLLIPVVYLLVFSVSLGHGEPRYLISVAPLLAAGVGYLVDFAVRRLQPDGPAAPATGSS